MWKSVIAASALVAAVSPLKAEPFPTSPDLVGNFGDALKRTIENACARRGIYGPDCDAAFLNRMNRWDNEGGNWAEMIHWLFRSHSLGEVQLFFGYPRASLFKPETDVGGFNYGDGDIEFPFGGVECHEITMQDTETGGKVGIPTMPLPPGGPMTVNSATFYVSPSYAADSRGAAALYWVHLSNVGRPREQWAGPIGWFNSDTVSVMRPEYFDPIDGRVPAKGENANTHRNGHHWSLFGEPEGSIECPPPSSSPGSDVHFYSASPAEGTDRYRRHSSCTFYYPNYSLGPLGYAIPTHVITDRAADFNRVVAGNPSMLACPISPELIRVVADRMMAEFHVSIPGYQHSPVLNADVQTGSPAPVGAALRQSHRNYGAPPAPPGIEPDPGQEPPGYTPPDRTGSGQGGYPGQGGNPDPGAGTGDGADIDLSSPSTDFPDLASPDMEIPEWFPQLDGFSVPEPSGGCPEFGFNAFGNYYHMDTHCTVFYDFQVTIGSIMLVVFTMMSFGIVMRA